MRQQHEKTKEVARPYSRPTLREQGDAVRLTKNAQIGGDAEPHDITMVWGSPDPGQP